MATVFAQSSTGEKRPRHNRGAATLPAPLSFIRIYFAVSFNNFRHAAAVGSVSRPVSSRSANNAAR
jgi:hypothetical protein